MLTFGGRGNRPKDDRPKDREHLLRGEHQDVSDETASGSSETSGPAEIGDADVEQEQGHLRSEPGFKTTQSVGDGPRFYNAILNNKHGEVDFYASRKNLSEFVNYKRLSGYTPFSLCASMIADQFYSDKFLYLMENGGDLTSRTRIYGATPLMLVIQAAAKAELAGTTSIEDQERIKNVINVILLNDPSALDAVDNFRSDVKSYAKGVKYLHDFISKKQIERNHDRP